MIGNKPYRERKIKKYFVSSKKVSNFALDFRKKETTDGGRSSAG